MDKLENDRIINTNDIAKFLGISVMTLYNMRKEGLLPKPKNIGKRRIGWSYNEIVEWFNSKGSMNK